MARGSALQILNRNRKLISNYGTITATVRPAYRKLTSDNGNSLEVRVAQAGSEQEAGDGRVREEQHARLGVALLQEEGGVTVAQITVATVTLEPTVTPGHLQYA